MDQSNVMEQSNANLMNETEGAAWGRTAEEVKEDKEKLKTLLAFKHNEIKGVDHKFSKWNKDKQNPFFLDDNKIEIPEQPDVIGKLHFFVVKIN